MLAAGADPAYSRRWKGFGKGIATLATDPASTVVARHRLVRDRAKIPGGPRRSTGSRFEGGG